MNRDWSATDIIDLYRQGYTNVEVCNELGITKRQFEKMCQVNPAFRDVVERGNDAAEAWNLMQSRVNISNKDFNTTLFNSRMQNLYGWSQKVDQNTKALNVNADMTKEELLKKLQTYLPDLLPHGETPLLTTDSEGSSE